MGTPELTPSVMGPLPRNVPIGGHQPEYGSEAPLEERRPEWWKRIMASILAQQQGTASPMPVEGAYQGTQMYNQMGQDAGKLAKGIIGAFHEGGRIPRDGAYDLEAGEMVLPRRYEDMMSQGMPAQQQLPQQRLPQQRLPQQQLPQRPQIEAAQPDTPPPAPPIIQSGQPPPSPTPAADEYQRVLGEPPQPQTSTWQRLLAAGVGGAAGYVNAGGRTRIPDAVTAQAITGIKYPNFPQAQRTWEGNVTAAKEAAGLEGEQADRGARGRVADARTEASRSAGLASDARTALYERQTEQLDAPADPTKNQQTKEMHDWLVADGFDDQAAWLLAKGKDPRTRQSNPTLIGIVAAAANGDPEAAKTLESYKQFQIDTRAPRQPRQPTSGDRRLDADQETQRQVNKYLVAHGGDSGAAADSARQNGLGLVADELESSYGRRLVNIVKLAKMNETSGPATSEELNAREGGDATPPQPAAVPQAAAAPHPTHGQNRMIPGLPQGETVPDVPMPQTEMQEVPPAPVSALPQAVGAVPPEVQSLLATLPDGTHTLSDGSAWKKSGENITRVN